MMSVRYSRCSKRRTRRFNYGLVLLVMLAFVGMASQPQSRGSLDTCSERPNCVFESRDYSLPADELFSAAIRALDRITPASLEIAPDRTRLTAVFRVFLFRDDVDLVVEDHGDESARLHIRSASRNGRWDGGVNARRVNSFFRHLERVLEEAGLQR
jgi:uncharacterized protein (DUF1499 family)